MPISSTFSQMHSLGRNKKYSQLFLKNGRASFAGTLALWLFLVLLGTLADPAFAQTVQFVPTGSMTFPKASHSATLLNSGLVLVAGGQGGTLADESAADLYDPATGMFTATGSMTTTRLCHTATLLNNGKVLFAGGDIEDESILGTVSAELYDPSTGTFTATGNMTTARMCQTATLLNNGQVLITGGENFTSGHTLLASAELYDPTTGTFTATGSMSVPRVFQTATLLSNGKVLVAGGFDVLNTVINPVTSSAEIYDPATGSFSATGSMTTVRDTFDAVLLKDGTVLVLGGSEEPQSAELYDPVDGTFTSLGNMQYAHPIAFTATLLGNGSVLIAGGDIIASAEIYDPATSSFSPTSSMTAPRYFHTATLLNDGQVLVAGGQNESDYLSSAELYALPAISFSMSSLSFGNETTGITSPAQNVTVTSNLPISLNISEIGITGTNPGDFAETDNCGSSLASGASCAASITFTPTAIGDRSALFTITDNALGSPQSVSLEGTGIAPAPIVSLSSIVLTFANQNVGSTSPSQAILLKNTGYAALNISSIAVTGTNNGDFAQTNTCGSSVVAGASCAINVTFTPTATGTRTASVTITDNASDSPESVSLTGNGVVPILNLATPVIFGGTAVGTTSSQSITPSNTGGGPLTISSITITGVNAGDFSQTNTCGTGIAAGGNCTITFIFSPMAAGSRTATLTMTDNAAGSPQTVSLSGTGLVPVVNISPSTVSFPTQYVGTSGLPQNVTLTNSGAAPLAIASVTASPSDYAALSSCGNSLQTNASCSIGVFFDPTVGGNRTGTLTITDNAGGSPQIVTLAGVGEDFSVLASSQTATIAPGQTASYSLSVSPIGGFKQTITFSCSGAPSNSTCTVTPGSAALNGSSSASVAVMVATQARSVIHKDPPATIPILLRLGHLFDLACLLLAVATGLLGLFRDRRPQFTYVLLTLLVLFAGITIYGCNTSNGSGGIGTPGTPAGNYVIAVSASFSSGTTTLTHTSNLTLTVQ
jgi:hypothetical protein